LRIAALIRQGKLVGVPIICTEDKGIDVSGRVQGAVGTCEGIAGGDGVVLVRLRGTVRNVSLSQRGLGDDQKHEKQSCQGQREVD
jgi:hypothetical protein